MKKLILLFIFLLAGYTISNAQEVLTNQSVIDMLEIGLGEDVIIAKITTSECDFSISINDLKDLKEKGVSDNIIIAMVKQEKDNNEQSKTLLPGLYFNDNDSLIKIFPTTFSGTKTNTLGSAFSYGIASAKIKSTMPGSSSKNIVNTVTPEFIFLFDKKQENAPLSEWWFSVASSPSQFVLVKLNKKEKSRELGTGKVNVYAGSSMGIDEESIIKFTISKTNDFEFKVIPEDILQPGEYCFFYQGVIPQGGYTNQSVFDFSIPMNCRYPSKFRHGQRVWVQIEGKIKNCNIIDIKIKDGEVHYEGEMTNSLKKVEWLETDCAKSKKELEEISLNNNH
ncbi:hypothetical protein [Bacteroides sp.]|uniref:hypothetical protein n=1 Tax=Bacteroides sp. TaxID=29523 RepID=UPI00261F95E6|nr:hypothetical protein [Bacteroides sp.]MDD3040150.1 hypothetical protein [Bacteroides sp.]